MSDPDKIWNRKFSLMVASNFLTSVAFYFMITALPVHLTADLLFGKDQTGLIIAAYILLRFWFDRLSAFLSIDMGEGRSI